MRPNLTGKLLEKYDQKWELVVVLNSVTRGARDSDVLRCTILKYAYAYFLISTGIHVLKEF